MKKVILVVLSCLVLVFIQSCSNDITEENVNSMNSTIKSEENQTNGVSTNDELNHGSNESGEDSDSIRGNINFAKELLIKHHNEDGMKEEFSKASESLYDFNGVWVMSNATWEGWEDYLEYYIAFNNYCLWISDGSNGGGHEYIVFDFGRIQEVTSDEIIYEVIYSSFPEREEVIKDQWYMDKENLCFIWGLDEAGESKVSTFTRVSEADFPQDKIIDWKK